MAQLSDSQVEFLKEPFIAQFVTLMKDGSPQITPVWVDVSDDGKRILINSENGRVKVRNVRRDPRVAIGVYDPENNYSRVLNVRGRVVEITNEGAKDHIDFLAEKYTGAKTYPAHNPDSPRMILKIAPDSIDSRI
jgi:PPOX class probable F420-dependent enzyme